MRYYSTNHQHSSVGIKEALLRSEAMDGGLYMPERLPQLPRAFINNIRWMSLKDITYVVTNTLFGDDFPSHILKEIGDATASYPMPLYQIEPGIYVLELFHGPTRTVKDFGAQMITRMMRELADDTTGNINVLVPTTGHTGNAVAEGLKNAEGVHVYVLHPSRQTLDHDVLYSVRADNIHTIEVRGTIDDCIAMCAKAFADPDLNQIMTLTSANSMNIGSLLPSTIPFFNAYARLMQKDEKAQGIHISVPSGNCGNLLAGYMSTLMGLPIDCLIGACNANAGFHRYMTEGINDRQHHSIHTYAYGMDMSFSANVPRFEALSGHNPDNLKKVIATEVCSDAEIAYAINDVYDRTGYLLDPHSATAYIALKRRLPQGHSGVVMATAHPSLSIDVLDKISHGNIKLPCRLKNANVCMRPEVRIPAAYGALKKVLKFYNESHLAEPKFA